MNEKEKVCKNVILGNYVSKSTQSIQTNQTTSHPYPSITTTFDIYIPDQTRTINQTTSRNPPLNEKIFSFFAWNILTPILTESSSSLGIWSAGAGWAEPSHRALGEEFLREDKL